MIFFITAPLFGGSMGLSLATAAAGLNPPMVVVLDASPPFERPLFPPWFIPPSPTSKREGTWRYLYDQNISLVSDLLAIKGKCERYKRHGFYLFSLLLLLNDYLIYLLWGINNNLYDVFSFQKKKKVKIIKNQSFWCIEKGSRLERGFGRAPQVVLKYIFNFLPKNKRSEIFICPPPILNLNKPLV